MKAERKMMTKPMMYGAELGLNKLVKRKTLAGGGYYEP
jgi:hypothetical protein